MHRRLVGGNDEAFDAVAELLDVEVDQEAALETGEAKVVVEVGLVFAAQLLGGFDLQKQLVFDDEVERDVALEKDLAVEELVGEAVAVGFDVQAWPEVFVDLHAGADDDVRQFFSGDIQGG